MTLLYEPGTEDARQDILNYPEIEAPGHSRVRRRRTCACTPPRADLFINPTDQPALGAALSVIAILYLAAAAILCASYIADIVHPY